jgi:hypothetical protein
MEWVKRQPCSITGQEPAGDAHHIIGIGNLSGVGLKPPDWASMPLTRWEHTHMHQTPEEWTGQWEYIVETLDRAIEERVLVYYAGLEPYRTATTWEQTARELGGHIESGLLGWRGKK